MDTRTHNNIYCSFCTRVHIHTQIGIVYMHARGRNVQTFTAQNKTGRGAWSEALRTTHAINSTKIKQENGTKHATVVTNGHAHAMHSEQSLGTRTLLG